MGSPQAFLRFRNANKDRACSCARPGCLLKKAGWVGKASTFLYMSLFNQELLRYKLMWELKAICQLLSTMSQDAKLPAGTKLNHS